MSASAVRTVMLWPLLSSTRGVAREDGHAGADGGLGEVHWRDVALLQVAQRGRQLALEFGHELTARSLRRVIGPGAAGEHDVRGKRVGPHRAHPPLLRRPHRPGGGDLKAAGHEGFEHRLPAGSQVHAISVCLGLIGWRGLLVLLLEGIIDRQRETRLELLPQVCEDPPEALLEMSFCSIFVTIEPVCVCCQLGYLWDQDGGKQIGVDRDDIPPQPNVEEVGNCRVWNVVVVGRVCADQ